VSDTDRSAFEGIQSATILKPGDRVLLVLAAAHWSPAKARTARDGFLAERFPDVEFTLAIGIDDVVVKPTEGSAPDA